jgi:chaperonin GroES
MNKKQDFDKLIVIGDRVLIRPKTQNNKSRGGLYLPPGYHEKEELQSGWVVKAGPGYPIPMPGEDQDEPWKNSDEKTKYLPLQVQEGDLAIFLQKSAIEVIFNGEKFFIVSHHSILLIERDEALFN